MAARLFPLLLCALVAAATASGAAPPVRVSAVVARGFVQPTDVTFAPGEQRRLYVVEQRGLVRIVVGNRVLQHPFLDLRRLVKTSLLQGLFSVAFHPGYSRDQRFYVDYVGRDGRLKVVEYRARRGRVVAGSARTLFDFALGTDHYGGAMTFGRDGRLYVGFGDGNVEADAQNVESPRGKILRFDVDDPASAPELVALGLRNPWRFAFDARGGLFVGDVGADTWEELDYLPAAHDRDAVANFRLEPVRGRTPETRA
ncbi:MAG: PQQ-dependent sugar dehydrogenase, partial [Gaiellaceae bacterium]